MELGGIDISIFVLYVVVVIALGMYAVRKTKSSGRDYFLAGEKLPWWLIGGSVSTDGRRLRPRGFAVLAAAVLMGAICMTGDARAATLDWHQKAYGDGRHNAFTDLALYRGHYYLCFRHGASHLSMDGEIRVMRSSDMKTWDPCATLDTLGDDRDPHFTVTDDRLFVYFGTWDLAHAVDNGVPGRGKLRSHFASSEDGIHWSKVQGVYESRWWLWRVRWLKGAFYSAAYSSNWPSGGKEGMRLLRSQDGLKWDIVSAIPNARTPDEADMRFLADGSVELVARSGERNANAMLFRSDPSLKTWHRIDLEVLIHSPVMLTWKGRCFIAGRGRDGDTAYPGLLLDPAAAGADQPSFLVSWYSQHARAQDARDEASVYVGRITLRP